MWCIREEEYREYWASTKFLMMGTATAKAPKVKENMKQYRVRWRQQRHGAEAEGVCWSNRQRLGPKHHCLSWRKCWPSCWHPWWLLQLDCGENRIVPCAYRWSYSWTFLMLPSQDKRVHLRQAKKGTLFLQHQKRGNLGFRVEDTGYGEYIRTYLVVICRVGSDPQTEIINCLEPVLLMWLGTQ